MRRLCLTLLCGLVVVPAAVAASHATGDGVLEIRNAAGVIVLNSARGVVWGQMTKGKIVVTDPNPGDGAIFVSNAKISYPADNVTAYTGKDLRFRVIGGKVKLVFRGSGISLTAVGIGKALLTGDAFAADQGDYAVDNSGKWNPVPVYATASVPFGVQPAPAP